MVEADRVGHASSSMTVPNGASDAVPRREHGDTLWHKLERDILAKTLAVPRPWF